MTCNVSLEINLEPIPNDHRTNWDECNDMFFLIRRQEIIFPVMIRRVVIGWSDEMLKRHGCQ